MQADEPFDELEIDWTPVWPDEDGRLEPVFFDGPQWIEFPEVEPLPLALEAASADAALLVGFEEFTLLDPEAGGEEPDEPQPAARQRASAASLAVSFGVHLVPLLLLIGWHSVPAQLSGAIPVQLVIEQAAAAPEETQPGRSVAADQAPQPDNAAVKPAESPPARPPTQVASVTPPAKPRPAIPRPRSPAPPSPQALAMHAPRPEPPPAPKSPPVPPPVHAAAEAVPPRPTAAAGTPPLASIAVRHEGTAANGGDYFAQLEQLTRPYLYMISPSFLAGRRGHTTLAITVADDGTIGRIGIKHSSGYPDIDARIEQMVAAVGRFPPLPQQLRRPGADLDFNLVFPDVLQQ